MSYPNPPAEPTLEFVTCPDPQGGHRMAYWQWGQPDSAHVVLCVHGLTRVGKDFTVLAQALCRRAAEQGRPLRVVCPDVAGRGRSDWLKDPALYQLPTYAADMLTLLQQLNAHTLDWLGTSMGGLIGLVVASLPEPPACAKVRRLVLNDVGPSIEWQALQRIGQYLGKTGVFDSEQQAADALWAIASSFGPHTPAQWLALTRPLLKPLPDGSGRLTLHYDPALAEPFKALTPEAAAAGEAMLWQAYDRITAQTLLVRGAQSDLLSVQTAQAMTQRGPRAQLLEFAGVGHAPTFVAEPQVQAVLAFLLDEPVSLA
ncbi:alpha/beta hydrolase [Rhodoferax sp.]|uniref:alpha/beta fold hydrolase n=1 Tax=Rhodoferax sp. TaxID=50421 RepID=UPI00261A8560|nr:alpha/beta hydrolase [Rhodoferax sp.]MDD4944267.1 alpha/beta hydrolase [Rhodoferax sp.]MDD5479703.1 alpha/beta hydrolase [Rhodoferax sp.]